MPRSSRNFIEIAETLQMLAILTAFTAAAGTCVVEAQSDRPHLTQVTQIRHFKTDATGRQVSIHVQAVVTYFDTVAPNLFVQDKTGGVWVDLRGLPVAPPKPGQLLDLHGEVGSGFSPYIAKPEWTVIGAEPFPKAVRLSYEQAATGSFDSQWVEMEGIVRSFAQQAEGNVLVIDVATPTGTFTVRVPEYRAPFPNQLVDAKVRFRGVCGTAFNQRGQLVTIHLMMPGLENLSIVDPAPTDPFSISVTPIGNIGRFSANLTEHHRVKVLGIVTQRYPLHGAFLMDSTGGVYAESKDGTPINPGDEEEVIGFPTAGGYSPVLKSASFRPTGRHQPITPFVLNGKAALKGDRDAQLVSIVGTVEGITFVPNRYAILLQSDDRIPFEATFDEPTGTSVPPSIGSKVKLTGICSVKTDANGNPASFKVVLRTPQDIALISTPPWLTGRRAAIILAMLAFLTGSVLSWVIILRRRVRGQTQVIKARAEKELVLEARYRRLFERNLTGLYIAGTDGTILDCNNSFAQILGYADRNALLEQCREAEEFIAQLHENLYNAEKGGVGRILNAEQRIQRRDGSWRWVLSNLRLVNRAEDSTEFIEGGLVDITERKGAEEQIQFLAYYDALTGLPNRRLLKDRLAQGLAGARRHKEKVAVLYIDLDRFKDINDSLGHSFGDLLLQEVAKRLKTRCRDEDTIARIGGDEFLIVLNSLESAEDASAAAESIMQEMEHDFVIQDHIFKIGCSIGISVFPEHGEDDETLIKNADAAMYSAKGSGSHAFRFFTEDMNVDLLARLTLEKGLRWALERDELSLVYQPQMDLKTGKVIGLEALLRWRSPELGSVSPATFIPVAETSRLIVPIGEWVLRTACAQAESWRQAGFDFESIAVNVSAVQFRREGFCDTVKSALADTGLPPRYLELELTESSLLSNGDVTLLLLDELKSMGVKLAVDDFGTGYSSLSYLRQFPVSKLKIDRSFINDVTISPDAAAITTAIIEMSKALGLKVIAEGVETAAQMLLLKQRHCDQIQGYFFSVPLTAENLERDQRFYRDTLRVVVPPGVLQFE